MDAILNLNLDFFIQPYYIGNHFIEDEWISITDFQAKSRSWLDSHVFFSRLKIKEKLRGCNVRDESQVIFHWTKMVEEKVLTPKQFTIINFSAHHDLYIKHEEEYYYTLNMKYHDSDSMLFPYIQEWLKVTIWVVPDYFTDEDIKNHFKYLSVKEKDGIYEIKLSRDYSIYLKVLHFRKFINEYNFKYFSLILNPKFVKQNLILEDLTKHMVIW
jgi:hypothetical protein